MTTCGAAPKAELEAIPDAHVTHIILPRRKTKLLKCAPENCSSGVNAKAMVPMVLVRVLWKERTNRMSIYSKGIY